MSRLIDFKRYRTWDTLCHAMREYCCAQFTRRQKLVGVCPRPVCVAKKSHTLKAIGKSGIAYCHVCHVAMDGLELIRVAKCTDYYTAAKELDILIETLDTRPPIG